MKHRITRPNESTGLGSARATSDGSRLPECLVDLMPYLAHRLGELGTDEHWVVSVYGRNRYVQFAEFEGNLRGETVGNVHLPEIDQLDAGDLYWLAHHGWNAPDVSGNHWRHWEPADPATAATVAIVTLHRIHGVVDPRQLDLRIHDLILFDPPKETL